MRMVRAGIFLALCIAPVSAQYGARSGYGGAGYSGFGRASTAGYRWGNFGFPGVPSFGGRRGFRHGFGGVYVYPAFVGGYGYGYPYAANQGTAAPPDAGQGGPPPEAQGAPEEEEAPWPGFYRLPADTGEADIGEEAPYFLIAFKDHTVYAAEAYYVEGDTLHYLTTGSAHNQVSLALIDRQLTERLNRDRGVDVRIP